MLGDYPGHSLLLFAGTGDFIVDIIVAAVFIAIVAAIVGLVTGIGKDAP
jgi:hypothetical protein